MKANLWRLRRMTALILAIVLALAASGCESDASAETAPKTTSSLSTGAPDSKGDFEGKDPLTPETTPSGDEGREDKAETVYVKADASGVIQDITVETVLKNTGTGETIRDYSVLEQIKNKTGDEEFTQSPDGTLLWENHGENICYEGKSGRSLPVSVQISYYLNDKPVAPDELAGQSGRVRICFDYINHTMETVKTDDKVQTVPVPFGVFSLLFLPTDTFSDLQVTNGKIIRMEDSNIVLGYACPGLEEALRLTDYEPAEEISIPDHVEITANVTEFQLDFTATIITPGLLHDLDLNDLDQIADLTDSMEELKSASGELAEGTASLYKGANTFQTYLQEYADGVDTVDEGAAALKEGLAVLNEKKSALADGISALQKGLESMNAGLAQISLPGAGDGSDGQSGGDSDSQSGGQNGGASANVMDFSAMSSAVEALAQDTGKLGALLMALQEANNQLQTFAGDVAVYEACVQQITAAVRNELDEMDLPALEAQAAATAKTQVSDALTGSATDTADHAVNAALDEALDSALDSALNEALTQTIDNAVQDVTADLDLTEEESTQLKERLEAELHSQLLSQLRDRLQAQLLKELPAELADRLQTELALQITDAIDLTGITSQTQNQLNGALAQLQELPVLKIPQISLDINSVNEIITDMQLQIRILYACGQALSELTGSLPALNDALTALQDGTSQLLDGSRLLSDGTAAFHQGIDQIYQGSAALADGTEQLSGAGDALLEGYNELLKGMKALKEGYEDFDREGVSELTDLAGEDLRDLTMRIRALKLADGLYTNYGGILDGQTGSVKFIIETEEIQ